MLNCVPNHSADLQLDFMAKNCSTVWKSEINKPILETSYTWLDPESTCQVTHLMRQGMRLATCGFEWARLNHICHATAGYTRPNWNYCIPLLLSKNLKLFKTTSKVISFARFLPWIQRHFKAFVKPSSMIHKKIKLDFLFKNPYPLANKANTNLWQMKIIINKF